jgi:hypothetical protein
MSNDPPTGIGELGSSNAQDTVNPIGVVPSTASCVLRTKSGKMYYTSTEVLVTCSSVFKDLVECCDEGEQDRDPGPGKITNNPRRKLEVPLEDSDEEIETLVEHLHQPDRFITSVVPSLTKEGAAKIINLAAIASKYDMQGNIICHVS